jgi:ABC-2 type transport system permease protein
MIGTLIRVHWLTLQRDRVAQVMRFVLPIAFFTIFALVFGGRGGGIGKLDVALVDPAPGDVSRAISRGLAGEGSLHILTRTRLHPGTRDTTRVAIDTTSARALVQGGDVAAAVVLPAGLDSTFLRFGAGRPTFRVLTDPSNPIAAQMVSGLLQKAVFTSLPDALYGRGQSMLDRAGPNMPARWRKIAQSALDQWHADGDSTFTDSTGYLTTLHKAGADTTRKLDLTALVNVQTEAVVGRKREGDMIAFYAAGIAVMFLLFASSAGAGTLLDEVDAGTLERVLGTRLGMNGLLLGKWLYLTIMGVAQITVMFLYAMLVFRLDLFGHLAGFAVMTVITAATAAAFGLFLATLSRTREQLGGLSTLLILTLSAIGGSMFPRFLMSDWMQKAGLVAFNTWALDGYTKVFWREAPLVALAPQVGVLLAWLVAFAIGARVLARRWEQV